MKQVFKNTGQTFSAKRAAETWLRDNGYSYGSTDARSSKVAIQKGEYTLPQKVHNFRRADFALADGWMTSCDYREGDVRVYCKQFAADVLRPVFDWSARQVMEYILDAGLEPNPLYRMGYKRVGCWLCVMSSQRDILNISRQSPERIEQIAGLEQEFGSSFFGPDKIPARAITSGAKYPLIGDVVRYVEWQNATGSLFDDDTATSCMSFYGLCE